MFRLFLLVVLIASVAAFMAPGSSRARMAPSMMFGKKKAAPTKKTAAKKGAVKTPAPTKKTAAKKGAVKTPAVSGYVPEGMTAESYAKALAADKKKAESMKKKFPIGKQAETLAEWMESCAKKGLKGKDMNLKGHRMVKAKYDEFYTDESPI